MSGRVIIVGSLNVDTVLDVAKHPRVGETVHARASTTLPGGKGGNQAVAAAAAGANVLMIGAVGADGERYHRHLAAVGVDITGVARFPDVATGAATVIVDAQGDNSIIVSEGANAAIAAEQFAEVSLASHDVVSLQFELPDDVLRAAAGWASASDATLIINPSPWRDGLEDVLELADVIVVNELEAAQLDCASRPDIVCTTLGKDGARWGGLAVQARRIEPVDTTGAGDAFTGTLATGLARGADRKLVLADAVAAASGVCLVAGAQRWRSV